MHNVSNVINDTISGQLEYYAQSFGARAVIRIPGLDDIPSNAIVHSATLILPVEVIFVKDLESKIIFLVS